MAVDQKSVVYLNGKQAATLMGVSYQRWQQMTKEDDPPPRGFDKKYSSVELGEWMRRRERTKMVKGSGGADLLDTQQESARKNKEMADKYELENKVRRGELIEVATVQATAIDMVMRVKARLLRLPAAAAPLVLGEDDRVVIQSVLDDQVRDALSELSVSWMSDDPDGT